MKKRFIQLFLILLAMVPGIAAAGGSCALQQVSGNYIHGGQILLLCTASSADATMSHTFLAGDKFMNLIDGRHIISAMTYDGAGTDPTANSDLGIVDSDGRVFVTATGNGLNVITNGTDSTFYFYGPDAAIGYPRGVANKPWTITWSNNAVNSAVHYLLLEVTGSRYAQ